MELRHLRYFVAVAEELHFRRAAERLHVAQPAISEQIRKLELELGVQLFLRTQRSVSLTPAGTALLEEARRVLRQADTACHAARAAHSRTLGRLRVGYLPDTLPPILPRLLRRFAHAAPGIQVALEAGDTRRLLEDVREARVDLAVVCLPAPVAGLRVVPIAHETLVAAVPEDHCCADDPEIELAALQRTRLVQLSRATNPAFYDGALAACQAAGIAPALVEVTEPALEQVVLAVAAGAGIALLPASAERRLAMPGVRFRPLAPPAPACTVALVGRRDAGTSAIALLRLATAACRPALPAAA